MNFYGFIAASFWPFVVLFLGIYYKKTIDSRKQVSIKMLPGVEISLGEKEAKGNLGQLFSELYCVYNRLLNTRHKKFFINLLHRADPSTVQEMIPDFDRNNRQHIGMLRGLRGLGMIEPEQGGTWKKETVILVTDFGRKFGTFLEQDKK